ncbi:MAG: hypothetical protein KKE42_05365 [Alphaproteobacteria bacterium]|uniref:hypothetical protein n=1 Tax=Brevundimonas sp. TaxID=1871086 RepID=UPI00181FB985|nr:hypothetical protein [Brevundimonas sp.]MBU3969994.1 hypothetical protein [Alphaproteobacteria bacterium]MBA3050704.1 hypothetical protein [Brevundimonas sp.]MBU3973212.1 hypothetical protein [Alphaproteobacteria bacterium]MBU4039001.1 hypothetical protein [Alphaproteobacteria bacterium]MBU4134993.1 hypothetical protein [Alphaproteobacteria bacterium]
MRLILAVMLSGLATAAYAAPQSPADAAGLARAACVDTEMDQTALAALAAEKRWSELPYRSVPDGPAWGVVYGFGDVRVVMTGTDATTQGLPEGDRAVLRPAQRTCSVYFRNPQGDWRTGIAALAAELGYVDSSGPAVSADDPREAREWGRNGKGILRMAYDPTARVLSVAIVRINDPEIRLLPSTNE